MSHPLDRIAAQRVVPVLRCADAADAVETARVCARAGMGVIELTRTTPEVERAVGELRGEGLCVGLGTLTSAEQVLGACEAGAHFVVSFAAPEGFVSAARAVGLEAIPGALTPGEVLSCLEAGAAAVKIFPARLAEPAYLRDLRALMPGLRAIVTGGLAAGDAPAWLEAGALAVGLGGELGSVGHDGAGRVAERAREALELVAASAVDA